MPGSFLYVAAVRHYCFCQCLLLPNFSRFKFKAVGNVGVIPAAAITTLVIFGVLTAIVFFTGRIFLFSARFFSICQIAAIRS